LKNIYGIDILLKAFAKAFDDLGRPKNLELKIYGEGAELLNLQQLAIELQVNDQVKFMGQIPYSQVPDALNDFDIYVALSRYESFGVAIIEANACGKPVIVSDADGPSEVTIDGVTGFVVKKEDIDTPAQRIVQLVRSPALRAKMGAAGRKHMLEHYTWEKSLDLMIDAYKKTINFRD
jgi:glycosyltransferase involved in cell wall biosynthesis